MSTPQNGTNRSRGRPATGKGIQFGTRWPVEVLDKVDRWAAAQPDKPGRADALRRLVEMALSGAATVPPKSPHQASDKSDSEGKVERAGPIPLPRQATQLKPNASTPAEDMKPYEMPEDINAFNEFWMKTEQGLERPLEYEEVIVLFNREREASEQLSDQVERQVH